MDVRRNSNLDDAVQAEFIIWRGKKKTMEESKGQARGG
jgi:hypothetical protein